MSDPTTTQAPTHDELEHLAVGDMRDAIASFMRTYETYANSPHHWAHMAATFQYLGTRMNEVARDLADALAAYAAAHPELEPNPEGVPVQILTSGEHAEFWENSDGTVETYAAQVTAKYGRPELTDQVISLEHVLSDWGLIGLGSNPVIVFQHFTGSLVADRPRAARVFVAGLDVDEHREVIERVFEHFGVVPVRPRYWPPVRTEGTVLSLPGGVYDAFGRPLDGPDEDELAARAGRNIT